MSQLFASGGQSIEGSASVLPMNIQGWFPLRWTGLISLQSKGLSRVFSNTMVQKHQFFSAQSSLWSNSHICTWLEKTQLWLEGPLFAKWCLCFLRCRTIKKAEHWRIDVFEPWCWRRLLRVPWTERRSNQSILKEISPEYSLEGLMLKLKLQYFGHLMWRADSLEKTLMLGKIEGGRRRGQHDGWMASPTQWT